MDNTDSFDKLYDLGFTPCEIEYTDEQYVENTDIENPDTQDDLYFIIDN